MGWERGLPFYIERRPLARGYNSNHATRLERVGGGTILTRYADYLGVLVGAVRGGSHRGTILYRNAELVRGLQFYIGGVFPPRPGTSAQ